MFVLLPCYSLEDFSLYRKSSEVDEIFSAWSALYHPALIARFDVAPRWEPAGSPASGLKRRLVVVPPCAEPQTPKSWLKSAEEEGAIVVRGLSDRDDILKYVFEKLETERLANASDEANACADAATAQPASIQPVNDFNVADADAPLFSNDAADSFMSVGLCCLLEELLTRKLRYMSNLDTQSFNSRLVEAARAEAAGNVDERERNLQRAFDLLAQAKEYFFPTASKFIDLTWVEEEDFADALPNQLRRRRLRNEISNVVLPVQLLKICRDQYSETFALLKEEIEAKRVVIIGGDEWESPLYLMSPLEIVKTLISGRDEYLSAFGVAPQIFGRKEAGYAQILPQLLKLTGYRAVFARTGDGWTLLEKPSDRSQFRWQGRDGSTVAAFCKKPLDATQSEEILRLPDCIGNSYYSDNATSIVFESRPGKEARWLSDLFRMSRYSPVLGKFYDFNEYFRITEGSGDKEKFVKDRFKTNFLTRSSKKGRADLVSIWPRRQRLGRLAQTVAGLETSIRFLTIKTKKGINPELDAFFTEYLERSATFSSKLGAVLDALDARFIAANAPNQSELKLLPPEEAAQVNVSEISETENHSESTKIFQASENPDSDDLFDRLNAEKDALADAAAHFVGAALKAANPDQSTGFLLINPGATPQNVFWETRSNVDAESIENAPNSSTSNAETSKTSLIKTPAKTLGQTSGSNATTQPAASDVNVRVFSNAKSQGRRQYRATLPPLGTFWVRRAPGFDYRFLTRPLFETGSLDAFPENVVLNEEFQSKKEKLNVAELETNKTLAKKSIFQKLTAVLSGATDAAAHNAKTTSSPASSESDATTRYQLAEYVEERFSAKEIERYYRLKNELFEIKIDPTTGNVRRLETFNVEAPLVSNGILRQPSRGNRFVWDFSLRLPDLLRKDDFRPETDSCFGYTTSAADAVSILSNGPASGRIRIDGRMVAPSGDVAATFTQIITIRRESRIIEVDVEISPKIAPEGGPWESYFGCRFAWKDSFADLLGGVGASLIWTGRDYLQAPECVDVRSEPQIGVTVLSAGLPYFKRISDSRLDAILIPTGETKRRFRFGIGVDLENPHRDALAFAETPPFVLPNVPRPKRSISTLFSSSAKNVQFLELVPILEKSRDANAVGRLNGEFVGVRLTLLEIASEKTTTTIKSTLPLDRIESVDFNGEVLSEKIELSNVSSFELEMKPRGLRVLCLYFRRSSLG